MRQLLVDLYAHGGRFATGPRALRAIRHAYSPSAVSYAIRKGYAEVFGGTLYLTPDAIDYIWKE